ncbi:MAG: hypothetical protein FJ271_12055 [Planctomycetes bacterium]|nr:hypothetical protein [Planctomycetota bacterium]
MPIGLYTSSVIICHRSAFSPSLLVNRLSNAAATVKVSRSQLEAVIVTATRRESRIVDVPNVISAISGNDIERHGVRDPSDLVRVVPGIAYLEQGPRVANNNNYIILRGLNAASHSSQLSYDLSAVWNRPLSESSLLRFAAGRRDLGGFIDYTDRVQPDSKRHEIP